MKKWQYREMGSRNKKTGKLSYYNVTVTNYHISDCKECCEFYNEDEYGEDCN